MQCLPLYRTQIVNTTIQICQRDKCLIPGMSVDIGSQQYDHKLWLLTISETTNRTQYKYFESKKKLTVIKHRLHFKQKRGVIKYFLF